MEIFRPVAASTYIVFPLKDYEGKPRTGASGLDSEWIAWSSTAAPNAQGNPGFQDMVAEATELGTTGNYFLTIQAAELPAASPYVYIQVKGTNVATQYILVTTATIYADVVRLKGTAVQGPVTAGYFPVDVKQTVSLSAPADNSIEKALARGYMATHYLDAAVSSTLTLATALSLTSPADNTVGKALSRMYMAATNYLNASLAAIPTLSTALTLDGTAADNSVGKALANIYFATPYATASDLVDLIWNETILTDHTLDNTVGKVMNRLYFATAYLDAAVSSATSASAVATAVWDRTISSNNADNTFGKMGNRLYHATQYLDAAVSQGVLATTLNLTSAADNTLGKALARMYMAATNYLDAAVTSRLAPTTAGRTLDVDASGGAEVGSFQSGAITNAAFAAGAIDAAAIAASAIGDSELAADGASKFADALLQRNIESGSSAGRTVREALYYNRNKVDVSAGTMTVYKTNDTTAAWTAAVATVSYQAGIVQVDPA